MEKPILAVKAGRTRTGAQAASSHTGALAGMDVAVDALFEQCGVIRATTLEELFDFAMAFSNQPVPRGDRVAIITNAGGPGILTADACESLGLEIAPLTEETRARLRAEVPENAPRLPRPPNRRSTPRWALPPGEPHRTEKPHAPV